MGAKFWCAALVCVGCGDNALPAGVLFRGSVWGENLALAGNEVLFTTFGEGADGTEHAVRAVPTTGGESRVIWRGGPHELFASGMYVLDRDVYWTQVNDRDGVSLFRAPLTGGNRTEIAKVPNIAFYANFAVDSGNAAYIPMNGEIDEVVLSGGPVTMLASIDADWIEMHRGKLYATSSDAFSAIDPVTGGVRMVAPLPQSERAHFAVDDSAAYLAAHEAIERIPLDGGSSSLIETRLGGSPTIIVLGPDAYYVDLVTTNNTHGDDDTIARVSLDGSSADVIATGLHYVGAMTTDGTTLYAAQCACSTEGEIVALPL